MGIKTCLSLNVILNDDRLSDGSGHFLMAEIKDQRFEKESSMML